MRRLEKFFPEHLSNTQESPSNYLQISGVKKLYQAGMGDNSKISNSDRDILIKTIRV
jgi:hypothetical protein